MWEIVYIEAAVKDLQDLDGSVRKQVLRAIEKVAQNPQPKSEGGYGNPLGNRNGLNLTGYMKIKLRDVGIRVVYRIEEVNGVMRIIIIGARSDDEVYRLAVQRIQNL